METYKDGQDITIRKRDSFNDEEIEIPFLKRFFNDLCQCLKNEEEKRAVLESTDPNDPSFRTILNNYIPVEEDVYSLLENFGSEEEEEVLELIVKEDLTENFKKEIVALLVSLLQHPSRKIAESTIKPIIQLTRIEDCFESFFMGANLVEVLRSIYDSPINSLLLSDIIFILSNLTERNDKYAKHVVSVFPLGELYERCLTKFNRRHEIHEHPLGNLLILAKFYVFKRKEISTEEFLAIIAIISKNDEINNYRYFHHFAIMLIKLIKKWPKDDEDCPISLFVTQGLQHLVERILSEETEVESKDICISYVLDGLELLAKITMPNFGDKYQYIWEFLKSDVEIVQISAACFWKSILKRPREEWNDIVNIDEFLELLCEFIPEQKYNVKFYLLRIVCTFILQMTTEEMYYFVIENETLELIVNVIPLAEARSIRLKALTMIANMYDSLPLDKKSVCFDAIKSIEWDDLDDLVESENEKISKSAAELKEVLDTYE